ncbi:MAG: hypothetical protein HUU35_05060, partial [Armatimonadetes bacterium]|nr:hypothetical protein [Armatimonadota bacterium]
RLLLPFDPGALPAGETTLICRLLDGERLVAETRASLRRLPPKPYQVKIDQLSRGLLVDGLPLLPFGMYAKWTATDVAEEEAPYGFTHLAPYRGPAAFITDEASRAAVIAALDRYAALGIKIHYDVRHLTTGEPTAETWARLKTEVEAVRDHPALLCYYLADEPELQGIPPERLAKAYQFIRALDPYHPCTQVFANRSKAPDYLAGMDIIMADPYPIPRQPVTEVALATQQMEATTGQALPLWIVPQMFGGGEWWEREPSPQEERVMTYLALIHGATGIQYFIRERAHVRPLPLLLNEVRALAAEAAELSPALLSRLPRPAVRGGSAEVHAAAWRTAEGIYVLAANTANRPLPLELTVEGAPEGKAEVLFEHREVVVSEGVVSDLIDAFGSRAYRLPLAPGDSAGLLPRNLSRNASFEEQHVTGSPDGYYLGGQPDAGAQVRVDSRLAVHGRHSLRVVVPAEGKGYNLSPFPIRLREGQEYEISVHARGLQPGGKLSLWLGELSPKQAEFTLTTEWQRFSVRARASKDNPRGALSYRLTSPGTAWLDLWQVVPLNP